MSVSIPFGIFHPLSKPAELTAHAVSNLKFFEQALPSVYILEYQTGKWDDNK